MIEQEFEHERRFQPEIRTAEEYWHDPRVISSVLTFLGGEGSTWEEMHTISPAFVGVGTEYKQYVGNRSPVSTIRTHEMEERLKKAQGRVELHFPQLNRESAEHPGLPRRVVLCWDIDRFHILPDFSYDEASLITYTHGTFESIQPVYNLYLEEFDRRFMPVLSVMTGKGFHLFTQVSQPDTMRKLYEIGGPVEPTVMGRLDAANHLGKNPGPIPHFHDRIFKGATRLQQWLNACLIRQARGRTNMQVEIWDKGFPSGDVQGIALDNTAALFPVNDKLIGSLGSPYFLKFHRAQVPVSRMVLQLPIAGTGYRYNWWEVLASRFSFELAADYLKSRDTSIPDGSAQVSGMISEYKDSGLRLLHEAMDGSMGDAPETFDSRYRRDNYEAVISRASDPEELRWMIMHANPVLALNRYYIDRLVFEVFRIFGGTRDNPAPASHVAGFLRAIYEDRHKGWGTYWMGHYDALRWARGTVEQVLGQLYEAS